MTACRPSTKACLSRVAALGSRQAGLRDRGSHSSGGCCLLLAVSAHPAQRAVPHDPELRKLLGAVVVIAANAGGAWTPIGDVTTTVRTHDGHLLPQACGMDKEAQHTMHLSCCMQPALLILWCGACPGGVVSGSSPGTP